MSMMSVLAAAEPAIAATEPQHGPEFEARLAAFEARDEAKSKQYSYEARSRPLDPAYEQVFRANAAAWAYFEAQPPSYRRVAQWWVMSAKREETRQKRLATLIEDSAAGRRIAAVLSPDRK